MEELRERYADADVEANRPWWPQDTSAGELALQMAGIAESLGSMGTLGDWAMVRHGVALIVVLGAVEQELSWVLMAFCVSLQLAKAAAQDSNPAVTAAVLERLPYLADVAAEEGDERLKDLLANGSVKGACSCSACVCDL